MSQYDFTAFTESVIASLGANASPRVKRVGPYEKKGLHLYPLSQCYPIFVRKLHEFLIEADITSEEWLKACNLLVAAGKVSNEKRNEVILITDIFGIESLVNTLDQTRDDRKASGRKDAQTEATSSAILGPFYRTGVPKQPNGTSIVRQDEINAEYTYLHGTIYDSTGSPVSGAIVDVWHDAPDGLYDSQSPDKPDFHCRGRFQTDDKGRFSTYCLRPVPYPIPYDHQAGKMLRLMDRHPMRPAHIHFLIEVPGHRTLVTQLFDAKSDYLKDDSVFAVTTSLLVDFKPIPKKFEVPAELSDQLRSNLMYEVEQDFHLERLI